MDACMSEMNALGTVRQVGALGLAASCGRGCMKAVLSA